MYIYVDVILFYFCVYIVFGFIFMVKNDWGSPVNDETFVDKDLWEKKYVSTGTRVKNKVQISCYIQFTVA